MFESRLIRAGVLLVIIGSFLPLITSFSVSSLAPGETYSLVYLGSMVEMSSLLPLVYTIPFGMLIVLGVSYITPNRRSQAVDQLFGMIISWICSFMGLLVSIAVTVWSFWFAKNIALPEAGWVFYLYGFTLSLAGLIMLQSQFSTQRKPLPPNRVLQPAGKHGLNLQNPQNLHLPVATASLEVLQTGQIHSPKILIIREKFAIGRAETNDLQLLDLTVSRSHAMLRVGQEAWFVQDQGSQCGTFVNGRRVMASRLRSGDLITIGHNRFLFLNQ